MIMSQKPVFTLVLVFCGIHLFAQVPFLKNDAFHSSRHSAHQRIEYDQNTLLLDYDIHFDKLNIFQLSGWWVLPTDTTLSIFYDYRQDPALTTNNALIGQSAVDLTGLFLAASWRYLPGSLDTFGANFL